MGNNNSSGSFMYGWLMTHATFHPHNHPLRGLGILHMMKPRLGEVKRRDWLNSQLLYVFMCVHVSACVFVCVCTHLCMCWRGLGLFCSAILVHVCMCVCLCVYTPVYVSRRTWDCSTRYSLPCSLESGSLTESGASPMVNSQQAPEIFLPLTLTALGW